MFCKQIHELTVFDVAHYEDRRRGQSGTLLSVDIDGTKVYSLALAAVVHPSACKNTVGVFRSADRRSLFAWIDPVSKECYIISELSPKSVVCAAYLFGVCAAGISRSFGIDRFWSLSLGTAVAAVMVLGALCRWRQLQTIKTTLKTTLESTYAAPIGRSSDDHAHSHSGTPQL